MLYMYSHIPNYSDCKTMIMGTIFEFSDSDYVRFNSMYTSARKLMNMYVRCTCICGLACTALETVKR